MIAVVDYGIGNLRSAEKALERVGADARLVTSPDALHDAQAIVLPGVGAFGACADALFAQGFSDVVRSAIDAGTPFLGLCVGFQLLFAGSEESPGHAGLGVFPGTVRRLSLSEKLPQMQWAPVTPRGEVEMTKGLSPSPWFYFVHSYAAKLDDVAQDAVALVGDYGGPYVAAIERASLWGTQFHPEKSGDAGLSLLSNFVEHVARRAHERAHE